MHRFYVPGLSSADATLNFPAAQSKRIARVLRMAPGEHVEIFDGAGLVSDAVLKDVDPAGTTATVVASHRAQWPFPWRPMIYLAMIRRQRFEWAIEKAAELGAQRIVPMVTARTERGNGTLSASRLTRWRLIAVEAAEQCSSAFVTEVFEPLSFAEALAQPAAMRLLAWESLEHSGVLPDPGRVVRAAQPVATTANPALALYFGPEGGFEDAEVQAAVAAGCQLVTLGPRLLRAETAAVAALAMLVAAAGAQSTQENVTGEM